MNTSQRLRNVVSFLSLFCCLIALVAAAPCVFCAEENASPPMEEHTGPSRDAGAPSATANFQGLTPEEGNAKPARYDPFFSKNVILNDLLKENFVYKPSLTPDPFTPFITPQKVAPPEHPLTEEDEETPPEPQKPLTPLQKMTIGEIEKGLKAIIWGELGRRAIIEDGSGKGYIVEVGTPAGDRNGVIAQIFNDHIVVQQESWDRKLKRMVPQNISVKLKKEEMRK